MVNCHLLPMQDIINRLSQSVLVLMGHETGGLVPLPRGCNQWDASAQSQGEAGFFSASPKPVIVPAPIFNQGNDSVPSLISISSSSSSSVSGASMEGSSIDRWALPSHVPTDYPTFANIYHSLEKVLARFHKENYKPYLRQWARPRDPKMCMQLRVVRVFQDLSDEFGLLEAQTVFKDMLDWHGVEVQHDMLGCHDCQWEG